jgi:hypothetical protein
MNEPKIKALEGANAFNQSFGPKIVDFLFHGIHEIDGRPILPSINPNEDRLALIKLRG